MNEGEASLRAQGVASEMEEEYILDFMIYRACASAADYNVVLNMPLRAALERIVFGNFEKYVQERVNERS